MNICQLVGDVDIRIVIRHFPLPHSYEIYFTTYIFSKRCNDPTIDSSCNPDCKRVPVGRSLNDIGHAIFKKFRRGI